MLVSHEKNFIFLKTIKTAGTSVEMALQQYCAPPERLAGMVKSFTDEIVSDRGIVGARGAKEVTQPAEWWNHMSAREVRDAVGQEVWTNYCKISIIRNPFDKVVSHFHFTNKQAITWPRARIIRTFNETLEAAGGIVSSDRHIYTIGEKIIVDSLIRFENLQDELDSVCHALGIRPVTLPRFKVSKRSDLKIHYRDYYGEAARRKVEENFAFELERFGYSF